MFFFQRKSPKLYQKDVFANLVSFGMALNIFLKSVLKCPNVEFYRKLLLMGEGFLLAEKLEGLSCHGLRLYKTLKDRQYVTLFIEMK